MTTPSITIGVILGVVAIISILGLIGQELSQQELVLAKVSC
jgi:hypothetical protein